MHARLSNGLWMYVHTNTFSVYHPDPLIFFFFGGGAVKVVNPLSSSRYPP